MDEPYNELILVYADGRRVQEQFRTVHEAMTAAEDYRGAVGSIVYHAAGSSPVVVVEYRADGSIEVGGGVAEDDEDEPWTEEELAENFARGRPLTAAERVRYGVER